MFDWILKFELMGQLGFDNRSEIKVLMQELIKRYHIKNVQIASYH